jgi:hypothetical protein
MSPCRRRWHRAASRRGVPGVDFPLAREVMAQDSVEDVWALVHQRCPTALPYWLAIHLSQLSQ